MTLFLNSYDRNANRMSLNMDYKNPAKEVEFTADAKKFRRPSDHCHYKLGDATVTMDRMYNFGGL